MGMPTEDQVDAYLRHLETERGLATRTVLGRRQQLVHLVRRGVPFEREAIAAYVSTTDDGSVASPGNRNLRLVVIRDFVRFLIERRELEGDPTAGIKRLRIRRTFSAALSADDVRYAVSVLRRRATGWIAARDEAIVKLIYYSGLRVSELVALTLSQVDLERALIREAQRKGRRKTDLVLGQRAVGTLREWLSVRPAVESQAVFVASHGEGLSVRMIEKRLKFLGEEAGLTLPLYPHALRHTHATELLNAGASVELVRQSLDHGSIATTQRYLHVDPRLLRDALSRLPSIEPAR